MIRAGIAGCEGRMGQLLMETVRDAPGFELSGGCDRGTSLKIEDLLPSSDIIIDFTTPDASLRHAALAAASGRALLIGTTGINDEQVEQLKMHAKSAPILLSANTSIGVNLLVQMVKKISSLLGVEYAIEIQETHHRNKIDAPSGTALALGRAAASGRGIVFDPQPDTGRSGIREPDAIGYAVMRGGDVVGEHTVHFMGDGERIELTHKASDRRLFARGAVQAARWLVGQKPGFYTMDDFLKLD